MERVGLGLCVAPKFMNVVAKWALCDCPGTDNYVDDLMVPKAFKAKS